MNRYLRTLLVIGCIAIVGGLVAQNRTQSNSQAAGQHASASSSASAKSSHSGSANSGAAVGPWRDPSKQVFAVLYSKGPKWGLGRNAIQRAVSGHNDYMAKLLQQNILLLAGPFMDGSGAEAVIQVSDEQEAYRIVAADPAVSSQIMIADAKPWRIEFEHMPGVASGQSSNTGSATRTVGGGGQ